MESRQAIKALNLLTLPVEIFDIIANHSELADLKILRLVCRQLNQQSVEHVFKTLSLKFYDSQYGTLEAFSNDRVIRRHVRILSIVVPDDQRSDRDLDVTFVDGWAQLKELSFSIGHLDHKLVLISGIISGTPTLQKLKLRMFFPSREFIQLIYYAKILPNLQEFHFSDACVPEGLLSQILLRFSKSLTVILLEDIQLLDGSWVSAFRKWGRELLSLKQFTFTNLIGYHGEPPPRHCNMGRITYPLLYRELPNDNHLEIPETGGEKIWFSREGPMTFASRTFTLRYRGEHMEKALKMLAASAVLGDLNSE